MNLSNISFLKRISKQALILTSFALIGSCMNLDKLSNDNHIAEFIIVSHEPKSIQLASTEIISDTIYVPISFGKYNFPLKFYADMNITEDIDKVIGLNLDEEHVFESIEDELIFYIMAKSGMTRTYVITPREIPLDEDNSISKHVLINSITPDTLYCSNYAIGSQVGDTLTLFTVSGDYPISLVPEFTIAPESQFTDFDNGNQEITFESINSVHTINVLSKSGALREWAIKLKTTEILSGDISELPKYLTYTTDIDPRTVELKSSEISDAEVFVDNAINTLTIKVPMPLIGEISFPLDFDFKFELEEGVEAFGVGNESVISFSDFTEVKTLHLIDPLTGISRKWSILLEETSLDDADVLSVSFDYVADDIVTKAECVNKVATVTERKPCIVLDNHNVEIYPLTNEIIISNSDFYGGVAWNHKHGNGGFFDPTIQHNYKKDLEWYLLISNIKFSLSNGATATVPLPTEWEMKSNYKVGYDDSDKYGVTQNTCYKEVKTFEIKSQNGTSKVWTMKLRDPEQPHTPSPECDILSFSIDRIQPNYAEYEQEILIDNANKTVIITLIDDTDCYPMTIYPNYKTSAFSKVTSQNGNQEPLIFDTPTSVPTVTVAAQDNTTSSNWSIKLLLPVKAVGADVESFQITGQSAGYDIDVNGTEIDAENAIVTVKVNQAPVNTPLNLDINMFLSDKATASIPLRGTIDFNRITGKVVLNITAQDGSSKLWTIVLDYRPQIPESNFDSWSNDGDGLPQPANPWHTANNPNVTGTTSEAYNGGMVPVMKAGSTLGVFASGSVFLGSFRFNMGIGIKDPISLTYFGYPMQATAKIKGIEVDVNYVAGQGKNHGMSTAFDYGSCVAELIDYNNKDTDPTYSKFQYHGLYSDGSAPKTAGRENNAKSVAKAEIYYSNYEALDHNGNPLTIVSKGEWVKIFIPLTYSGSAIPEYTHVHIIFGCSGRGDLFNGFMGSVLKVDNVKLIYE